MASGQSAQNVNGRERTQRSQRGSHCYIHFVHFVLMKKIIFCGTRFIPVKPCFLVTSRNKPKQSATWFRNKPPQPATTIAERRHRNERGARTALSAQVTILQKRADKLSALRSGRPPFFIPAFISKFFFHSV